MCKEYVHGMGEDRWLRINGVVNLQDEDRQLRMLERGFCSQNRN
jgi:hypothetical protein